MRIPESELIINPDGSIYHLNLLPEDIANTIITVGDPDRVTHVTQHFESIEVSKQKREFKAETGYYKGKRITVISTGIGTDNIDIVFNELDALVNIDFSSRTIKKQHTSLNIVRIGTSGTLQNSIPVDSFLMSELAVGFDSLLHFYNSDHVQHKDISNALIEQTGWIKEKSDPYVVSFDESLGNKLKSDQVINGFTATNVGFYGPQSRKLRLAVQDVELNEKLANFSFNGKQLTNLEMETAGIYGLAKLLGHKAVSMNAILANRATGEFSVNPEKIVNDLIVYCLDKLVD
ncbi:nucleoside phosphorylase [Pseudofulvibacter geojedonensis]|uniref:Uridine phosphorylase n=1 Tax=Pseudofulvibacter geojedonensis TaxID=1123758 RepID=A0ABW3HYK0_9FLAO